MITIKRILCPIDFSKLSTIALDYAVAIARWYGAEITALHACTMSMAVPAFALPPVVPPSEVVPNKAELEADLEALLRPLRDAGVPVAEFVTIGNPVAEILDRARQMPADLIVMATHGLGGFERLALGSVTEKVLRKATCPVLTVSGRSLAPGARGSLSFKRILCPVDFSDSSSRAVRMATSLSLESGGRLTLLHVLEAVDHEPSAYAPFDVAEYRNQLRRTAEDRLQGMVPQEARTWCEAATIVTAGKAWREILRVAETVEADLIVMGVLGRRALDLMLFGSTTHHVVREAACPVLTVRA